LRVYRRRLRSQKEAGDRFSGLVLSLRQVCSLLSRPVRLHVTPLLCLLLPAPPHHTQCADDRRAQDRDEGHAWVVSYVTSGDANGLCGPSISQFSTTMSIWQLQHVPGMTKLVMQRGCATAPWPARGRKSFRLSLTLKKPTGYESKRMRVCARDSFRTTTCGG